MNLFIPDMYYKNIYEINFDLLKEKKVKYIFFDVDNTLLTYEETLPNKKVINFIKKIKKMGFECILFSNSNNKRIDDIKEKLEIEAFTSSMKPLKKNYKKVLKLHKKNECIFVGDQIMTDVLGAKRCGFKVILVNRINNKEPLSTKFWRVLENIVLTINNNKFNIGKYYE